MVMFGPSRCLCSMQNVMFHPMLWCNLEPRPPVFQTSEARHRRAAFLLASGACNVKPRMEHCAAMLGTLLLADNLEQGRLLEECPVLQHLLGDLACLAPRPDSMTLQPSKCHLHRVHLAEPHQWAHHQGAPALQYAWSSCNLQ